MQMISKFGYKFTWNVMTILAMVGVLILFLLMTFLKKEKDLKGKTD